MEMKTEMTNNGQQPMMSSREIAVVVLKGHKEVCRDIRVMLVQLYGGEEKDYIRSANLLHITNQGVNCIHYDQSNPNAWEYFLDYEHSQCLATGYDAIRRMSMVKQWRAMKEELAQPRITAQPTQPVSVANHDILSLARVVAEATASATMKAVMEVSSASLITAAPVSSSVPQQRISSAEFINTDAEFVPVHKVSWETGLSDPSCRRLVQFANLPSRQLPGVRGLCVHRESFLHAFQVLLEESTRPGGKRKRWQHPEFGGFILRKDPKETLGEVDA
ncbi:Rha family transcriptional regulator [Citrobacter koseri]|uniref:Rha family transcriptional regulator n=1 Tax=Citrobacter koseri TaxID=545 RepID=UPI001F1A44C2|nr:Rha family transcriptional regulator [Citrobacter koseri]